MSTGYQKAKALLERLEGQVPQLQVVACGLAIPWQRSRQCCYLHVHAHLYQLFPCPSCRASAGQLHAGC